MPKLSPETTICLTRPRSTRSYDPWTGVSAAAQRLRHMLDTVLIPACNKAGYNYRTSFQPRVIRGKFRCPVCPSSVTLSLANENNHYRHEMTLSHIQMVGLHLELTGSELNKLITDVRALMFECDQCDKHFTRKESLRRHQYRMRHGDQEPRPAQVKSPRPPKVKKRRALPAVLSRLPRAAVYDSPEPAAPLACAPPTPSSSAGPSSIDGGWSPASQLSEPVSTPGSAFEPWLSDLSPPVPPSVDPSWMPPQLPVHTAAPAYAQPRLLSANTREIVPIMLTAPQPQPQLWDDSWMLEGFDSTAGFDVQSRDEEFDMWANMPTYYPAETVQPQIYDAYPDSIGLGADQPQWGPQDDADQWAYWISLLK